MASTTLGISKIGAGVALGGMVAILGVLGARVAYLQTYGRAATIDRVDQQQHQVVPLQSRRGSIFDRNGLLLAGTVRTNVIFADPKLLLGKFINDPQGAAKLTAAMEQLSAALNMSAKDLHQLIDARKQTRYIKLREGADENMVKAVRQVTTDLKLPGISSHLSTERIYPMGTLAAHVLGGMTKDGVGVEGIEAKYNRLLKGEDGFVRQRRDARRNAINVAAEDYLSPVHGRHVVLTLDANIQQIAEQELEATCKQFRAKRGEAVVMDPATGEVLALANWPTYSPAAIGEATEFARQNYTLTAPYEPGSTLKPFILGPALDAGAVSAGQVITTGGKTRVTSYGRRITDVHGYSSLSVWDVLVKSSNIGMTIVSERFGKEGVHRALSSFGFGRRTGIELSGEDSGLLRPLARWDKYSVDSLAQGYEIMVTPLQLVRAMAVFANDGYLVRPTLVKGELQRDGDISPVSAAAVQLASRPAGTISGDRVIPAEEARQMRQIMADVVIRGTGIKARSDVYNLFGKTGTAHIALPTGGYDEQRYTSSFIGGGPVESPRIVVALIVHEADKSVAHFGGAVSAPGAGRIMSRSLAYLNTAPSPAPQLPDTQIMAVLDRFNPKAYERKPITAETMSAMEDEPVATTD
jgi:cell division protein FtsI/penicillin-binding protein 2